jgi:hypothetical protein
MSNAVQAMFIGVLCLTLSGVMWKFSHDAQADTNVDATWKPLYPVFAGLLLLGGLWEMGAGFGFCPSPQDLYRRRRSHG